MGMGLPLLPKPQARRSPSPRKRPREEEDDGREPKRPKADTSALQRNLEKKQTQREMEDFNARGFKETYGGGESALDWVRKQKRIQEAGGVTTIYEEQFAEEEKRKKQLEHTADEMSGIHVGHNIDNLPLGKEMIMTFAD